MNRPTVPPDVRRFILTSVPSVPYLEALLLLRAEHGRRWDSYQLASRLYIGESQAQALLQALAEGGIAVHEPDAKFVYQPATAELRAKLDALAQVYAQDLVGVSDLIHSGLDKRAQQFADAFRWRKEDN